MKSDIYAIITDRIIGELQKGNIPWEKPWNSPEDSPKNLISKKDYRGINSLLLASQDYTSPYWLTFKQANDLGGHVKKGEKSMPVVYWNWREVKKTKTNGDGEEEEKVEKIAFLRYYSVFNLGQCELPSDKIPSAPEKREINSIEKAEQIVEEMPDRPEIKTVARDRACYVPTLDIVELPEKSSFKNAEFYYDTLFHELVHSTGHEKRLDRKNNVKNAFGSSEYSKEELVAEIGAAFLCGQASIAERVLKNDVAYIQSWLGKLKDDPKLIIHAAAQAQKAADFILNRTYQNGGS